MILEKKKKEEEKEKTEGGNLRNMKIERKESKNSGWHSTIK